MGLIATIPHFNQPHLDLGFAQIYAWGVLVACGFLFGTRYAAKWSDKTGSPGVVVFDYAMWVFIGGFSGAHLFHAIFYVPETTLENPLYLLYFWDGFSSFGGFFGAAIASVIFFSRREQRFLDYADSLALGFMPGWAIGRVGCFLANDHPGIESNFFLAVDNEFGIARHDLGLYDSILSWVITAILLVMAKRSPGRGAIGGWMCLLYAFGRFFLDYLRIIDKRYLGLTPAQYSCLILFIFGAFLIWNARQQQPFEFISATEDEDDTRATESTETA